MRWLIVALLSVSAFGLDWAESFEEATLQAKKENKIVMAMFSAEYCKMCKFMKEQIHTDERVEAYIETYFVPVEIDIDEHKDTFGYKVFGTPTYYFIRGDGSTIGRALIGGAKVEMFLNKLKEYKKDF